MPHLVLDISSDGTGGAHVQQRNKEDDIPRRLFRDRTYVLFTYLFSDVLI